MSPGSTAAAQGHPLEACCAGPGVAAWPSLGILVRGTVWASSSGQTDGRDFP